MKKLTGMTAVLSGVLLITLPRTILPACEFEGFPAMHCSDTARAELIAGIIFIIVGISTIFLKSMKADATGAALALVLSVISFMLPDIFGYCHSTRMPCNYGMVPGIRFIAVSAGLIMVIAVIGMVKGYRKKGNA